MSTSTVNVNSAGIQPDAILQNTLQLRSIQRELKSIARTSETRGVLLGKIAKILQQHSDVTTLLYLERNDSDDLTKIHQLLPLDGPCEDRLRQQMIISSHTAIRTGDLDLRIKTNPNMSIATAPVLATRKSNDALAAVFGSETSAHQIVLLMQLLSTQIAVWLDRSEQVNLSSAQACVPVLSADATIPESNHPAAIPLSTNTSTSMSGTELEASAALDLIQQIIACDNLEGATQRLATALAAHLACQRVAVGLSPSQHKPCKLSTISDLQRFDSKSEIARALESAMDEAIMRGEMVSYPNDSDDGAHGTLAQKRLCSTGPHENCITLPLINSQGVAVGAIVVADVNEDAKRRVQVFLNAAQPSISIALQTVRSIEGDWFDKTLRISRKLWKSRKAQIAGVCIALASLAMLLPVPYKIHCESVVEPVTRRYVAAPFEGTLDKTFAKAGDVVAEGDLLAKMDDQEIEWERASLVADKNQALKKRDSAQASHHYSDQQIAQLEAERIDLKIKLLDHRSKLLEIRSPFAGMIASGDLERAEGAKLKIGQTLFEIAPLDKMILEVAIADSEIAHVAKGQQVDIRLDAFPGELMSATITRIEPRSELRDRDNVFIAQVEVDNAEGKLRPGMKGRVRVRTDNRMLGWIVFHKAWEASTKAIAW